jgi:hypothetical protein
LSPGNTFAALAFFNVLKFPLMYLGQVTSSAVQSWVAITRLSKYLSRHSTEDEPLADEPLSQPGSLSTSPQCDETTSLRSSTKLDTKVQSEAVEMTDVVDVVHRDRTSDDLVALNGATFSVGRGRV